MPTSEVEEFAKTLVEQVREAAIQSCDRLLRADAQNVVAKRWRRAAQDGDLASIARVVIPDIVDETVFHLLRSMDQELLRVSFTASSGRGVDLPKDGLGELGGWYKGSDGWRAKFSRERFVDDFSDLK